MKKITVVWLLMVVALLSGCSNSGKGTADTEDNDLARMDEIQNDDVVYADEAQGDNDLSLYYYNDEAQVPQEVLQWFIDSGILEYPCSEEAWHALFELEHDYEMFASLSSDLNHCAILPQGYRLIYVQLSDGIFNLSLVGPAPEGVVFRAAREDFPALEQKIRSVLQQTE